MTWRAVLGPPSYPSELQMNWVVKAPQGSAYAGGFSGLSLPGLVVLPDPKRARSDLAPSRGSPLVPECGFVSAEFLATVILLDCRTGDAWVTDLSWSRWTARAAVATGVIYTNDWCVTARQGRGCQSSQNQQSFIHYPVTVVLQRARRLGGQLLFTFASVRYHIAWAAHTTFRTFTLA
jgi:hypothetical protein